MPSSATSLYRCARHGFHLPCSRRATPVVGGRTVPFRHQRLTGIVVELHDRKPTVTIKSLLNVLDTRRRSMSNCYARPLDCRLLSCAARRSLPYNVAAECEFKHTIACRSRGSRMALHLAGVSGRPRARAALRKSRLSSSAYSTALRRKRLTRREHTSARRKTAFCHARF